MEIAMKKSTKKTAKQTKAPKTATPKGAAKPKVERPSAAAQSKRVSALDAAALVLQKSGQALRTREMISAMAEQGLWQSPNGKTPHATLYAAILREMNEKGRDARFRKVERGKFEFVG